MKLIEIIESGGSRKLIDSIKENTEKNEWMNE